MRKILLMTISIIIICLLSLSAACCEMDSEEEITNVVTKGYLEQQQIEVTPISVVDSLGQISFGKYPQTINPNANVSTENKYNGYYLGSDNNYYAYRNGAYFKVEEVIWDSYQLENGDILLVSRDILFAARYDDYEDYFESEREIFDEGGFVFSGEEASRVKTTGVEYSYRLQSSVGFSRKLFLLNIDQVTQVYQSASKVVKKPTDYSKKDLSVSDYGNATWWLAPQKGKSYYISQTGSISNKDNTYIEVTDKYARARFAWRGVAPAMIISSK